MRKFLGFLTVFVLLFTVLPTNFASADASNQWMKRLGGVSTDDGLASVSTDSSGNIVVVGTFNGGADANGDGDKVDGIAETAVGYGQKDIVISFFDVDGNHQWSQRLGGNGGDDYAKGVAFAPNGNIVVTGYVYGDADMNGDGDRLDGGAESGLAYKSGGYNSTTPFISVFNSSGVHQWAKRFGAVVNDGANGVAVDSNGNIIVAAYTTGNADMNGDGDALDGGAESATGYSGQDAYVTVFNSSGVHQWAKRFGGASSDSATSVAVDGNNNIIVGMAVTGSADLNGNANSTDGGAETPTAYNGSTDGAISVFNSSGAHQWSKRIGGTNTDSVSGVAVDTNNNIILTGSVKWSVDFDEDGALSSSAPESYTGYNDIDAYIAVYNSSGTYQWAKRLGGTSYDVGYGITTDSSDRIILTGYVYGNADLNGDGDSGDGGAESSSGYGLYDVFISAFDSSGIHKWAKRLGSSSNSDIGYGIAVNSINDNIIVVGQIETAGDLNGDGDSSDGIAENATGVAYGYPDGFISVFLATYNTAPTDIAISAASVDENVALGTTVGTLSTTDSEGGAMTYSLVAGTGDTDNASFTISGSTLQTNTALDFETKSSYSVRIQTEDDGALTYAEAFTITVNDVVENVAPVLSSALAVAPNGNGDVNISVVVNDDDDDNLTVSYYYELGACSSYSSQPAPTLRSASDGAGSVTVSSGTATSVATTSADNTLVVVWDTVADFGDTRGDYCVYIIANDGSVDSNEVSATVNISGSSSSTGEENSVRPGTDTSFDSSGNAIVNSDALEDSDTSEESSDNTETATPVEQIQQVDNVSEETVPENTSANTEEESSNQDSSFEAPIKSVEITEKIKDVVGTWAESYIDKLREKGLFADIATETKPGETKTESAFVPDAPVKRGELIKMSMQAFGYKVPKSSSSTFSDVKSGSEYVSYIEAAKKAGYIKGYSDGTFRPDESVNRVEALAIILKISGVKLDFEEKFVFPDTDANAWYADFISYAVEHKIISGYKDGNFGPNDKLTRSQAAKVLVLVMERL